MSLKVVKSGKYKPCIEEGKLHVTVTGDSHEELLSPEAKKVAWNYRFDKGCPSGFGNAGVEGISGVNELELSDAKKGAKAKKGLCRAFALTAGL